MLRTRFLGLLLVLAFLPILVLLASGRDDAAATHGGSPSPELTTVGQLPLSLGAGSISDIWAYGDYAYLGSFYEPVCTLDTTGVYIVDISEPSDPTQVGFIPSPPNTRANDVKVEHIETPRFSGEILVVTNEPCFAGFIPRLAACSGAVCGGNLIRSSHTGVAIYDVTNPLKPRALKQNFLRFPVHNTFIYQQGDNAYMLVVDDVNLLDVHIIDITKPWSPKEIAVTGAPDWTSLETLPQGASFVHDVWVQENGSQMTAYLSYWDSGLVLLDITDPTNPVFLGDSEYIDADPLSGQPPEGNSHVAVPTDDGNIVIMGDEDFDPFRVIPEITSGPFDGETFNASQGSNVPQVDESNPLVGPTRFVGLACGSAPSPGGAGVIAVIERGACAFTTKAQTVSDAGYVGGIVLNSETGNPPCEAVVSMLAVGDIPFLFVARSSGFKILGITGYDPGNCPGGPNPSLPAADTAGEDVSITAQFDGWGYMRVLDVSDPANIVELGQFATENVLADPPPPGDHTMHNVIVDGDCAYISWYADGMRVVDFSTPTSPTEIAHFVDSPGSNFWGVFLHDIDETTYILGSDRDSGLWIFDTPDGCP
ncbi:MAG: PA domain-containing protein [Acidimicrobiia bacterium]